MPLGHLHHPNLDFYLFIYCHRHLQWPCRDVNDRGQGRVRTRPRPDAMKPRPRPEMLY